MAINVKTSTKTTEQLTQLSKKRKSIEALNKTKIAIVAELVDTAHKKECKS